MFCVLKRKKEKKGASFHKHFSENYHSIWDQCNPGAKNRINRQHLKIEKVRLLMGITFLVTFKTKFQNTNQYHCGCAIHSPFHSHIINKFESRICCVSFNIFLLQL
jgi:hypothetical protein